MGSALRAPGATPAPRLTLRPGQSGIRPPHARPDWEDWEALEAWQSYGIVEPPVAGTPAARPRHVPEPPGGSGAWQKALAGARGSPWNCWNQRDNIRIWKPLQGVNPAHEDTGGRLCWDGWGATFSESLSVNCQAQVWRARQRRVIPLIHFAPSYCAMNGALSSTTTSYTTPQLQSSDAS